MHGSVVIKLSLVMKWCKTLYSEQLLTKYVIAWGYMVNSHAGNYRCGCSSHLWMDCYTCFQLTDCLCCTCSCSSESHYILSSHWHTVIAWGFTLNSQEIIHVATPLISACSSVHILINLKRSDLVSDLVSSGDSPWALTSLLWVHWILELWRKFQTFWIYWTYKQNNIL